jgi:hypothetical protein
MTVNDELERMRKEALGLFYVLHGLRKTMKICSQNSFQLGIELRHSEYDSTRT